MNSASDMTPSASTASNISTAERKKIIARSMVDFLVETIGEKQFSRLDTVLEFGCSNTGFLPHYMDGKKAYGVDLHSKYADHWKKLGVEYLVSDGRTIPLPDNSIHLVVSHSVLEHIPDLPNSLAEIDRVLKPNGIAFLTVSPLYYSPRGHHKKVLPDWEHLRPDSPCYMMQEPLDFEGTYLNKLTMSEFLGMVGNLPWNIERMERKILSNVPDWLEGKFPKLDLLTRGFRMVARKL